MFHIFEALTNSDKSKTDLMYLFFDTETTGLPKNWKAPVTNTQNWPRMVQIGWIVCDEEGRKIEEFDCIIKPENYTIPEASSNVHGITTEKAIAEGKDLKDILVKFNNLIEKADYIVAHNIKFDEKIVGAEFIRKDIESSLFQKERLCTMDASTNFCRIPGPYGYKWPKLSELHIKLFGVDFEGAHDAFADIKATEKCFWELKKRGLI